MANEENLKKGKATQFQSGEEAARNGQKGGVASGASRRRRKAMKQTVNTLLGTGLNADAGEFLEIIKPRLLALGIDEEDATYQDVLLAGIMLKAMKGDVRAAEFIRDTAGESPALAVRKQELQMRKSELKFKQEQAGRKAESDADKPGADSDGGEERVHIYLPDNGRFGGE